LYLIDKFAFPIFMIILKKYWIWSLNMRMIDYDNMICEQPASIKQNTKNRRHAEK